MFAVGDVPILETERHWYCPACHMPHVTVLGVVHTPMHECRALRGLMAPFVPRGVHAVHRLVEREDYVGDEDVRLDGEGRPTMSIITEREDGQDCTVFAPTARVSVQ